MPSDPELAPLGEVKDLIAGSLHLILIGLWTMQQKAEFQKLHRAYRSTWRHFVIAVDWWQSQKADSLAAQEFALIAGQAESLYRESRNELADYMISNTSKELLNVA